MVQQQVNNVLRHLQKAHGIPKEEVTASLRRLPHFQVGREYIVLFWACFTWYMSSVIVPCESAKEVYKSSLGASLSIRLELNWK